MASEPQQTATVENADTKSDVDWYNDQVACITGIQLEDVQGHGESISTENAWNYKGRSSFVADPANYASEIGAIMKNSTYTNTIVNGSLSMAGKILNLADELTSSLCTAAPLIRTTVPSKQATSFFNNAHELLPVKSCKVQLYNSNPAMIKYSLTAPTMAEIIKSFTSEKVISYDKVEICQLPSLQVLSANKLPGMVPDENPFASHSFLRDHSGSSSCAAMEPEQLYRS